MGDPPVRTRATLGCATLWLCPPLPNFAWLMAQPKGQTGEPLSYLFQFVVCAHHGHSVDARLDCARVLHGDVKHLGAVVCHHRGSLTSALLSCSTVQQERHWRREEPDC